VLAKIHEEIGELQQAIDSNDKQAQFEETGDLLFSCVNLSRHLQLDAEESLRACNAKFEQRFNYIEDTLRDTGREFGDCDIDTLEQLWQQAKDA
jgi:ATP diphosphatase